MVRPSAGTSKVLGLNNIKVETPPTCAYIMLGDKCRNSCKFCAQGAASKKSAFLSRVTWKIEDDDRVYRETARCYEQGALKRACFQVVRDGGHLNVTLDAVRKLKSRCSIPVCVSINGVDIEGIEQLIDAGVEFVAISFDAVTPSLYEKIKGGGFDNLWHLYEQAVKRFPNHIVVHAIAGLGETEKEMVDFLERLYKKGTPASLFAFTPLPGTEMAKHPPPPLDSYRRLQAAHYIIRHSLERVYRFDNKGRIVFDEDKAAWMLKNLPGRAFETAGCPDCNRPLYNERPGQTPYNYPRPLSENERVEAVENALDMIVPLAFTKKNT